jgi:hypothetical protein
MVKKTVARIGMAPRMMLIVHARQQVGAAAGVRYGLDQSAGAAPNEYLIAENKILRSHPPSRLRLSDPERSTLAEIGKRVGRKDLQMVSSAALPETILAWYRRLIAQ